MRRETNERFTRQRRRLALEPLESRLLLSGNITAAISGSTATIEGDADNNKFLVEQVDAQTLRITGQDGTTVNWAGGAQLIATDGTTAISDLTIRTGDGNDTIDLNVLDISGSLFIDTGPGKKEVPVTDNDDVKLTNVRADKRITVLLQGGTNELNADGLDTLGDLYVVSGADNDDFKLKNANVGKSVRAYLGDGTNEVDMDTATIGKDLLLEGGVDRDSFDIKNLTNVGKSARLYAGDGPNDVDVDTATLGKDLFVEAGDGNDTLDIEDINAPGSIRLYMGEGTNNAEIDRAVVGKDLLVEGGDGNDTMDADDINAPGSGRFYAGEGNNTIAIEDGVFGKALAITSGNGNDEIAVSSTQAVKALTIAVSGGANRVELFDLDLPGSLSVVTGDGDDILEADSLSAGGKKTQLATEGGDDRIDIERKEPEDDRGSTFNGAMTILAGDGDNDVVRIGLPGDADNLATFLATSLVDGGPGINDTLVLGNVAGPLNAENFEA